jgi:hypothetical protein
LRISVCSFFRELAKPANGQSWAPPSSPEVQHLFVAAAKYAYSEYLQEDCKAGECGVKAAVRDLDGLWLAQQRVWG